MDLRERLAEAIKLFWTVRESQGENQEKKGSTDQSARSKVIGGAHLNGIIRLVSDVLIESGVPANAVYTRGGCELPGYFRPTKQWDLLVVEKSTFLASIEFKSQVGSFGNNFNNRTEEAIGSAVDLGHAISNDKFQKLPVPWLGYMFVLEDCEESRRPVRNPEPHFAVFPEFKDASYTKRYEILLERLLKERLYNAACLITTQQAKGQVGQYKEPHSALAFERFVNSLLGHLKAVR